MPCPVCGLAVGIGVGLCRWLGISDLISGTWIGALIVVLALWTIDWLDKKNIRFLFRKISVFALYYAIIIVPLYWMKIIGGPANKFLGFDKLVFGIFIGSIAFAIGVALNNFLKKKNQGKSYFPFQKVVLPISFLLIASLIFYFTC
ncbi:MAG: hypothetical protein PHF44_03010 [Candidatus Pacebacteria bacterium]|nr:hypothetical protein [Candidatus Paceibacterota bacterium]